MVRRTIVGISAILLLHQGQAQSVDALLDTIQHASFKFFWYETDSTTSLIKDRNTVSSPSSIASVGFGLSAICVGIDHGWISRDAGRNRVLSILTTFWTGPQGIEAQGTIGYRGLFYHFLDMRTGVRTWDCELSSIDTGLLLAGIIDVRQYFSSDDSLDVRVRGLADSIYYRTDWDWMRDSGRGLKMGWKPGTQFTGFGEWIGYNEAMIMYILALGSPTHPVPPDSWNRWTDGYSWQTHYGYTYVNFPPLFGHQYSHCWIDFRGIQDSYMNQRGIDYFENSRRATLAQRAYCIANPGGFPGYSDSLWGITASDSPFGYRARGAPPPMSDDGTITPTAPAGSIPFAPEAVIPVLRNMYNTYHTQLWTGYGFRDAFNLKWNWWDPDVIGIDQGPIVLMIENYRTERVWKRFMKNPDIQRGLQRAGFVQVTDVEDEEEDIPQGFLLDQNYPNPFNGETTLRYGVPTPGPVRITIYDLFGRKVETPVDRSHQPGIHAVTLRLANMASGVYICHLSGRGASLSRRLVLMK